MSGTNVQFALPRKTGNPTAGRLKWMGLMLLALGTLTGPPVTAAESPPFRLGFSTELFSDINNSDAKAAIKVWAKTVAQERGIDMNPEAQLFDRVEDIIHALEQSNLDAISLTYDEYLQIAQQIKTAHYFITQTSGELLERYILLASTDSSISNIQSVGDATILLHKSARTSLALPWLHQLATEGQQPAPQPRYSIEKVNKVSSAVLPVFFGKEKLAAVAESGFEMMCELNPQLKRKLRVIERSPELIPAVMCFRKAYQPPHLDRILSALNDLHATPAGEQVLMLFQSEALVEVDKATLMKTADLFALNVDSQKPDVTHDTIHK